MDLVNPGPVLSTPLTILRTLSRLRAWVAVDIRAGEQPAFGSEQQV